MYIVNYKGLRASAVCLYRHTSFASKATWRKQSICFPSILTYTYNKKAHLVRIIWVLHWFIGPRNTYGDKPKANPNSCTGNVTLYPLHKWAVGKNGWRHILLENKLIKNYIRETIFQCNTFIEIISWKIIVSISSWGSLCLLLSLTSTWPGWLCYYISSIFKARKIAQINESAYFTW